MTARLKRRVFDVLEGRATDSTAQWFAAGMIILIAANVLAVVLQSVESIAGRHERLFWHFEVVSVGIFTVEYLFRLWASADTKDFRTGLTKMIRFAFSPLALVDLAAIAPFYLSAVTVDLRLLRTIRIIRLVRVLKLGRYSAALATIKNVLLAKKEELAVSVIVILLLMLLGSGLLYMAERDAQPDAFASIIDAFWWAILTLSTVDYVDARPITPVGRFLGMALALLDLALLCVPTGILGSGFVEEFERHREPDACPRCGERLTNRRSRT
jgi:voltage-gated potassium channel